MATSAYEAILNLEITTLCLNGILESYINDMHQSRAIRCINRLEEEDSKLSIILTELKDILKNIFIVTAIHVHLRHDIENYKREDFKKSHINESAEFIITLMQKRRDFISSILAYKEMITK
jgi:hypothetical protein